MTTTHPRAKATLTRYAVCRPARTGNGDPLPVLIAERLDLEQARLVALDHLDAYPHVWIEEWQDARGGCSRRIVERFHRREMVTV